MAAKSATFLIDCDTCHAKVAALEEGRAERHGMTDYDEPWGERILIGSCPKCRSLLVGRCDQLEFGGYDAEYDAWGTIARVYPRPPKEFSSRRIPDGVTASLTEADLSLQVGANVAACLMFGRALEALCRNVLEPDSADDPDPFSTEIAPDTPVEKSTKTPIMLGAGIKLLKDRKIIDDRLYDWSEELHAFRNIAAHPDPDSLRISRTDVEDLQVFTYAIIEYVYDLAERYDEFKKRMAARNVRPRHRRKKGTE